MGRVITFYPYFIIGYKLSKNDIKQILDKNSKLKALIILLFILYITKILFINIRIPIDALNFRGSFSEYTS